MISFVYFIAISNYEIYFCAMLTFYETFLYIFFDVMNMNMMKNAHK